MASSPTQSITLQPLHYEFEIKLAHEISLSCPNIMYIHSSRQSLFKPTTSIAHSENQLDILANAIPPPKCTSSIPPCPSSPYFHASPQTQPPCHFPQASPQKAVAIIGSNIAGTTTAYFLHDYFRALHSSPISITIYESSSRLGGHVSSSQYRHSTIEEGAQYWSEEDWCLKMIMSGTGLKPKEKDWDWKMMRPENAGVWNGDRFVVEEIDSTEFSSWWALAKDVYRNGYSAWLLGKWKVSFPWWDMLRYIWKYGSSPLKLRAAVLGELGKFARVGEGLSNPPPRKESFDRLETELTNNGLSGLILGSANRYMSEGLNLSTAFIDEVVSPLNRAQFGRNLEEITGLAALIAVRDILSKKISIKDGNERLPYRLARLSIAKLELNSRVRKIEPGITKRYKLSIESPTETNPSPEFDAIIIAAPVSLTKHGTSISLDSLPSVNRYITIFATDHKISHDYFNLSSNTLIPNHILTTTNSSSSIYSITTLSHLHYIDEEGCLPADPDELWDCDELKYEIVYRILSAEPIDDCALANMVGEDCGFEFPFLKRSIWPLYGNLTRERRDDVEIFPFIFSTGGAEGVVESEEMSCRMGYNALGKLYMRWR